MCLAKLKVSTQSCQHRWYFQVRPCEYNKNVQTCQKISLDGWEEKSISCPFCSNPGFFDARYKLIGNDRKPHVGGLQVEEDRRLTRSPSLNAGQEREQAERRGERNRMRNSRVDKIVTTGKRSGSPAKRHDSVTESNIETSNEHLGVYWTV